MTLTSDDLKSIIKRMDILKLVENDTSNVFLGRQGVYKYRFWLILTKFDVARDLNSWPWPLMTSKVALNEWAS